MLFFAFYPIDFLYTHSSFPLSRLSFSLRYDLVAVFAAAYFVCA